MRSEVARGYGQSIARGRWIRQFALAFASLGVETFIEDLCGQGCRQPELIRGVFARRPVEVSSPPQRRAHDALYRRSFKGPRCAIGVYEMARLIAKCGNQGAVFGACVLCVDVKRASGADG